MTFYIGKLQVGLSFWFLAAMALFILLDRSFVALSLLGVILLHEAVHLALMLALGARVRALRLHLYGARLDCDLSALPAAGQAAVYLGAPLTNLLCGIALYFLEPAAIFGAFSLCVGAFNLIPVPPLDGGNALQALFTSRRAGRLLGALSLACLGAAYALAVLLSLRFHNYTLLACALYLTACLALRG